jgi:uncharacterized membrane protein YkvA (DUF1232 family)
MIVKNFIKRYWLLIISLIYLIWPIDLVADIFGPIGLIDDLGLLTAAAIRELVIYFKSRKQ